MAAPDGAGPAMEMLVPPKRLNTAARSIFDAVRAAAHARSGRTALVQKPETHLTRAAGRTVRFCHDDCRYAEFHFGPR